MNSQPMKIGDRLEETEEDPGNSEAEGRNNDLYGMPTIWDYKTDPNNPTVVSNSTIGNNYLYHGRRYDPETNLYYYRARYYDPLTGRFLSTDPMGYQDSMNLYQAFNMNGVNFLDPMGEATDFNYYGTTKTFSEALTDLRVGSNDAKILLISTVIPAVGVATGFAFAYSPELITAVGSTIGKAKGLFDKFSRWAGARVETAKYTFDTKVGKRFKFFLNKNFPGKKGQAKINDSSLRQVLNGLAKGWTKSKLPGPAILNSTSEKIGYVISNIISAVSKNL